MTTVDSFKWTGDVKGSITDLKAKYKHIVPISIVWVVFAYIVAWGVFNNG